MNRLRERHTLRQAWNKEEHGTSMPLSLVQSFEAVPPASPANTPYSDANSHDYDHDLAAQLGQPTVRWEGSTTELGFHTEYLNTLKTRASKALEVGVVPSVLCGGNSSFASAHANAFRIVGAGTRGVIEVSELSACMLLQHRPSDCSCDLLCRTVGSNRHF